MVALIGGGYRPHLAVTPPVAAWIIPGPLFGHHFGLVVSHYREAELIRLVS